MGTPAGALRTRSDKKSGKKGLSRNGGLSTTALDHQPSLVPMMKRRRDWPSIHLVIGTMYPVKTGVPHIGRIDVLRSSIGTPRRWSHASCGPVRERTVQARSRIGPTRGLRAGGLDWRSDCGCATPPLLPFAEDCLPTVTSRAGIVVWWSAQFLSVVNVASRFMSRDTQLQVNIFGFTNQKAFWSCLTGAPRIYESSGVVCYLNCRADT